MNIQIRRTSRWLAAGALLPALAAGVSPAAAEPLKTVRVRVVLDKEKVAPGADVGFVLIAKNTGKKTVVLRFNSSRTFDFVIYSKSNHAVMWRRSTGLIFAAEMKQIYLSAGDKISFRGRWNQKTANGTMAAPGSYSVVGIIPEKSGDLLTDGENFKIKKD